MHISAECGLSEVPGAVVACDVLRRGESNELRESELLVPDVWVVDCSVSPWTPTILLQCDMCKEPIPSPGDSSTQAVKAMYKCHCSASKTKDKDRRYLDLVPVVFSAEDGVAETSVKPPFGLAVRSTRVPLGTGTPSAKRWAPE